MPENNNKSSSALKVILGLFLGFIIFLLLLNGVAGYLLYKNNMKAKALKKQVQQMDSLKR